MQRGEVWWARLAEEEPVVLLSAGDGSEIRAMQIVAPATDAEKRGFVVLTGAQASDTATRERVVAAAGSAIVGVEVAFGRAEGLPYEGVVRVALPRDGHVFCTWLITLTPEYLVRRIGALSPTKLAQLDDTLRLAGIE